jgi:hypothetical protein
MGLYYWLRVLDFLGAAKLIAKTKLYKCKAKAGILGYFYVMPLSLAVGRTCENRA